MLKWLRDFFEEALGWQHEEQFLCVAFQNRMAAMIGGTTFHSGGDLPKPGENRDRKLEHSDVDNLYVRNAALRWILIDEISDQHGAAHIIRRVRGEHHQRGKANATCKAGRRVIASVRRI